MDRDEELIFRALGVTSVAGLIAGLAGYDDIARIGYYAGIGVLAYASIKELLERKVTVELLMFIVGVILAYHNVILEGLVIYILYSIAEVLEAQISRLALRKLESAKKLIPRRVRVERDGTAVEVKAEDVKAGDKIIVRRGEVVPVDGILLGKGIFDTSMITGEAVPRTLDKGSYVESGYINVGDPVIVKALKPPGQSTLQILVTRAVELLENKGRIQRLIESLAPYMIVAVLGVFALTYLYAEEKAVAVLLAGCPSAFIITSAASTSYTISILAGKGVIVRGGAALEAGSKVRVIVIDKTGTVSMGLPRPVKAVPPPGFSVEEFKSIVAAVAGVSLHPVSKAIASTWKSGITVRSAREYPGRGVEAEINGYHVLLGSREFIAEKNGSVAVTSDCGDASLVAYASVNGSTGYICLEEMVDEESIAAVSKLKSLGYKLVLASGDSRVRVERMASKIGIEEYYYEMKPEDKAKLVDRLRRECNCRVSMIGDGVNDLEALATSDFGVAIGNIDAVSNVADAVLARGFKDSPLLYGKTRSYMKGLLIGFVIAAIVKIVTIVFGLTGAIPLWLVALIGDDGSTLLASIASILTVKALSG
ncbi:MAG: cadmium-translocating P-type ATPase [Desulfurococcales archaeon]|nr:cadmium-translocating P-type ATPase [Desulfurococcales archaeon]